MMLVRAVAIAGSLATLAIVARAQSQPAPPPAVDDLSYHVRLDKPHADADD